MKGHEGTGVQEFNRPSGICCDDDGNIIIADSKNQRVSVFSRQLTFMWSVSTLNKKTKTIQKQKYSIL